jgi:hypothetical protein
MGINSDHFRYMLTRPILKRENLWSEDSEELIMLSAAAESHLGEYLVQLDNGPARGILQMEPRTFHCVRTNVVPSPRLTLSFIPSSNPDDLIWDLRLAIVMARLAYWRHSEPIPHSIPEMAKYWKKYYNTEKGKGNVDEAIELYYKYVKR